MINELVKSNSFIVLIETYKIIFNDNVQTNETIYVSHIQNMYQRKCIVTTSKIKTQICYIQTVSPSILLLSLKQKLRTILF